MQGRFFFSISDFQGCHYWCLHFLFQLWIYLTVIFLIVISKVPMLHVCSTGIGHIYSWTRIQNNSRSTDKGWEADMKSLSWGMNCLYICIYRAEQLSRVQIPLWKGFWVFMPQTGWPFFPREEDERKDFLVASFQWMWREQLKDNWGGNFFLWH